MVAWPGQICSRTTTGSLWPTTRCLVFKHGTDVPYDTGVLQPNLAAKWEQPDPMTYVFHLRPGIKFANMPPVNGRDLTSSDIKWSYEYWSRSGQFKDKKLPPSQYASYFEGVAGIDATDPQTATVRFSKPFVPFINYTASYFNPIVPHDIYDADGKLSNQIAGTGPGQIDLQDSQKGSRWVWKRNPAYWDTGKPYVDEVHWIVIADEAAATSAFQTKQVDILGIAADTISARTAEQIKKANPTAMVAEYLPVGTSLYLNINCSRAPLKDARVRQAISFGLDRDEFIKTISAGRGGWALSGSIPRHVFTGRNQADPALRSGQGEAAPIGGRLRQRRRYRVHISRHRLRPGLRLDDPASAGAVEESRHQSQPQEHGQGFLDE